MPQIGYYNGTFGDPENMTVPMNDRAVYFGDGCYEACLVIGTKAFRLDAHIDRFYRSLSALSIPFFSDRDVLRGILDRCMRIANEPCAVLYWQASRGTAPRTHAFPEDGGPNLMVTVRPKTLLPRERTLKLVTAEDVRAFLAQNLTDERAAMCVITPLPAAAPGVPDGPHNVGAGVPDGPEKEVPADA